MAVDTCSQWPTWRKYAVLLTMGLFSFIGNFGASGTIPTSEAICSIYANMSGFCFTGLAPALEIIEYQLLPPQSVSNLTRLVAVSVLLQGCSNIFWVPLANTFGRRPVLILSLLMGVFFSMWCGLANTYSSLLAARALQGIAFGPGDTICPDVVGEVFFVHQRGRALVRCCLVDCD